jgi:hypothetical protein
MNKHTPGPWKADIDPLVPERGAIYVEGPSGWHDEPVCSCDQRSLGNLTDVERCQANARLIAAAPDLYEVCNGLLGLLQLIAGRDDCPAAILEVLDTNHRVIDARAALAKVQP